MISRTDVNSQSVNPTRLWDTNGLVRNPSSLTTRGLAFPRTSAALGQVMLTILSRFALHATEARRIGRGNSIAQSLTELSFIAIIDVT